MCVFSACVYGCSQKKQSSEGPSLLVACMFAFSAAQWISFFPKAQPVPAPQPAPALQPVPAPEPFPAPQPAPKPQLLLAAVLPGGDAAAGAAGVEAMPAAAKDGEHKVGSDLFAYQSKHVDICMHCVVFPVNSLHLSMLHSCDIDCSTGYIKGR